MCIIHMNADYYYTTDTFASLHLDLKIGGYKAKKSLEEHFC